MLWIKTGSELVELTICCNIYKVIDNDCQIHFVRKNKDYFYVKYDTKEIRDAEFNRIIDLLTSMPYPGLVGGNDA